LDFNRLKEISTACQLDELCSDICVYCKSWCIFVPDTSQSFRGIRDFIAWVCLCVWRCSDTSSILLFLPFWKIPFAFNVKKMNFVNQNIFFRVNRSVKDNAICTAANVCACLGG